MAETFAVTEANNTFWVGGELGEYVRLSPGEYTEAEVNAWVRQEQERVVKKHSFTVTYAGKARERG